MRPCSSCQPRLICCPSVFLNWYPSGRRSEQPSAAFKQCWPFLYMPHPPSQSSPSFSVSKESFLPLIPKVNPPGQGSLATRPCAYPLSSPCPLHIVPDIPSALLWRMLSGRGQRPLEKVGLRDHTISFVLLPPR